MPLLCPTLGWDYSMEIGSQQANLGQWNLDSLVLHNFSTFRAQDEHDLELHYDHVKGSGTPQSTSSADQHYCVTEVAKKLNHNASERDRRKKINSLYSTLRALLPANDHTKKLSIPNTVAQVLKYIPELQKEVDELIKKKQDLISKTGEFTQNQEETKSFVRDTTKNDHKQSCSISTNKLGDKEMVIQISALREIPLHEVLFLLEKYGLVVLNVSSFRSLGGSTFCSVHVWIEGSNNNVKCERLIEELPSWIQKQRVEQLYV